MNPRFTTCQNIKKHKNTINKLKLGCLVNQQFKIKQSIFINTTNISQITSVQTSPPMSQAQIACQQGKTSSFAKSSSSPHDSMTDLDTDKKQSQRNRRKPNGRKKNVSIPKEMDKSGQNSLNQTDSPLSQHDGSIPYIFEEMMVEPNMQRRNCKSADNLEIIDNNDAERRMSKRALSVQSTPLGTGIRKEQIFQEYFQDSHDHPNNLEEKQTIPEQILETESEDHKQSDQDDANNEENISDTKEEMRPLRSRSPMRSWSIIDKSEGKQKNSQKEGSFAIFRCPIVLEKYNVKLWIVYLDNLLEVLFRLPMDMSFLIMAYIVKGKGIQRKEWHVCVHVLLVFVPLLMLVVESPWDTKELLEVSYWYHAFRGQSTLKLYGVLMTADVVDKMLSTVGEYLLLDVLWQKMAKSTPLQLFQYIIPAILYVFTHSVVLFLSMVGYNVILNSDISSLFVLIFVHNSMKLKSSIFKKFTKDGYTQQTHADLRTRFDKCLCVFLIWASMHGFSHDILRKLIYFLGSEVLIEWIKHIFLMLLNNLQLSIVESMNKTCMIFVAKMRIIPAFKAQEILNNKALQSFVERENYLAQTPYVSPSLKIGFRINFLAFHHAVIILKMLFPLIQQNFNYHNLFITILVLRCIQIVNDILLFSFSFHNNEIIKLYTLKNSSIFKTLFSPRDILVIPLGCISLLSVIYKTPVIPILQYFLDTILKSYL